MSATISLIKGDGIGTDVGEGAEYFVETGLDIEPQGEEKAGSADAIFMGAIDMPSIRHADGTEISTHLRLHE